MIDEDVSRRTIALSIRTGKLTARGLAYVLQAAGRKIQKERRAHQTPHGRQSVKKLMAHGAATNSIELTGAPKEFDRVARKWNVDYAFYKTGRTNTCCSSSPGRRTLSPLVSGSIPAGCWIRQRLTAYPSGNSSDGPPPRYCASPRPKRKTA